MKYDNLLYYILLTYYILIRNSPLKVLFLTKVPVLMVKTRAIRTESGKLGLGGTSVKE